MIFLQTPTGSNYLVKTTNKPEGLRLIFDGRGCYVLGDIADAGTCAYSAEGNFWGKLSTLVRIVHGNTRDRIERGCDCRSALKK